MKLSTQKFNELIDELEKTPLINEAEWQKKSKYNKRLGTC